MDPIILIKSLSSLVVVFLLMYFCFVLAKKRLHQQKKAHARLRVLEHQRIEQKLSVSLIAVDNDVILLAAGPQGLVMEHIARAERSPLRTNEITSSQIH